MTLRRVYDVVFKNGTKCNGLFQSFVLPKILVRGLQSP